MAPQNQRRAVGSNQYVERLRQVTPAELSDATRATHGDRSRPPAMNASNAASGSELSAAASAHREALNAHMEFATNVPADMSDSEALARMDAGVRRVADAEDLILGQHPNAYGTALVSANKFMVRINHDLSLSSALSNGDAGAEKVRDACEELLADAEQQSMSADDISRTIEIIEGGGECPTVGTVPSDAASRQDAQLCRDIAALSTVSARSSDPAEIQRTQDEISQMSSRLRSLRLQAISE